jgi:hypothetical protein
MLMVPEILQVAIVGMMILIPTILIYKKVGLNPVWAALVFLPGFGLFIIFWQLAFWDWPKAKQERGS